MELSQSAQAAVADLEKRLDTRAKWVRIGGALVVIDDAIRLATAVLAGSELKTCDDITIRDTVGSGQATYLPQVNYAYDVRGCGYASDGDTHDR